jgi:hypothetical protein
MHGTYQQHNDSPTIWYMRVLQRIQKGYTWVSSTLQKLLGSAHFIQWAEVLMLVTSMVNARPGMAEPQEQLVRLCSAATAKVAKLSEHCKQR